MADYFDMLVLELTGQPYSKTEHRRRLGTRLAQRSEGSIEFKHRNITAVLIEESCPHIAGYAPSWNYQGLLREAVERRLINDARIQPAFASSVAASLPSQGLNMTLAVEGPPRAGQRGLQVHEVGPPAAKGRVARVDWFAVEARNWSVGLQGELLVLEFERERLRRAHQPSLADRVEHVAVTLGDGLGFDIRSFDVDGSERLIEVKSTAYGKETPFFVSQRELLASREAGHRYQLSRVFRLREAPGMFRLTGALDATCRLDPAAYRARVAS